MNLGEKFNQEVFLDWIDELLPNFQRDIKKVDIPKSFLGVSKIETLGESSIGVRVFVFQMDSDPIKKRITITKDSFNVLKNHSIQNAVIAYYSPNHGQWRLSFLTSSATWENGKIVSKLSNLKRQSFVVGEKAKVKTPTKYLANKIIDLDDLKKRFSIEVVNKDFYKEISKAFNDLQNILHLPSKEAKSQTNLEFSVRLIGRIIFCWFLREKKSENNLSLISNDLLSLNAIKQNPDYYHKILEPLFFEILNKPKEKRRLDEFDKEPFAQTPYLNGGLFSAQSDDFYNRGDNDFQSKDHDNLNIPDSWFEELFEVLETYNFTIDENTSYDEELSIDPEMLGRIFENLLAEINPETGESARKSTGSYYTPRVIVDYMVDESLFLYLKNKTGISEEKLKALISYDLDDDESNPLSQDEKEKIINALGIVKILDPACGSGAFPIGALQKIVFILQQIDPHAKIMYESYIKNTPPEFRKYIQEEFDAGNFDYLRKLRVIRESIYGVDIQPIATEISRLRCFLTLVVDQQIRDEREDRGIKPLPNLDFKFVTANSLIGLPKLNDLFSQLEDEEGVSKLSEIRNQYFNPSGDQRYKIISDFYKTQRDIDHKIEINKGQDYAEKSNALRKWNPFEHELTPWFDPEWMFGIKDGFDIVIANPPYVGNKGHKDDFQIVQRSNLGQFYNRSMDMFYFFFHLALNLSKDNAIISLITTNYFLTATAAIRLRRDIKNRSAILDLINFNELKIFEAALGQHNMITILKKQSNTQDEIAYTSITKRKGIASSELIQNIIYKKDPETTYNEMPQSNLYDGEDLYIRISNTSNVSNDPIQLILNKIKNVGTVLDLLCNVNQGIVTGANKVRKDHIDKFGVNSKVGDGIFVLSPNEITQKNINPDSKNVKPWYKNSDIKKYFTNESLKESVLYFKDEKIKQEIDKPILNHFEKYKEPLISRLTVCKKNQFQWNIVSKWINRGEYYLLFYPRKQQIFENPKIVVSQRSPKNIFGYNEIPWYAASDVIFITDKDKNVYLKYVLALLNSRLYYAWLYFRGKRKGETLELMTTPIKEVPIKVIPKSEQLLFVEVVDKIIKIKKDDPDANIEDLEHNIDGMIYELYELTKEEIKIVEESIE